MGRTRIPTQLYNPMKSFIRVLAALALLLFRGGIQLASFTVPHYDSVDDWIVGRCDLRSALSPRG